MIVLYFANEYQKKQLFRYGSITILKLFFVTTRKTLFDANATTISVFLTKINGLIQ
jgi:hypothetical protein